MSVKRRRDSKNRLLREGERHDKATKRYVYMYYVNSKQQKLYSWKLEPTDRLPTGKRDCLSLREKIAELKKKSALGLESTSMTVSELVDKYTKTRNDVKATTRAGYKTARNILEKEEFGSKQISKVKVSDAKLLLIKLQKEDGKSYSSIHTIRGVVRPAFQIVVDDDILVKNPFDFQLAKVLVNDSVARNALTKKQERDFLSFVENDKHFCKYYGAILLLLKTGMPTVAMHWEHYFNHMVEKYNKIYKIQMPNVTPHICRHTCCTNLVKRGLHPKTVQYLMGHSEIGVTLNYYTHYAYEDVKEELEQLDNNDSNKIKKFKRAYML